MSAWIWVPLAVVAVLGLLSAYVVCQPSFWDDVDEE